MKNRVVITGIGVVAPNGIGADEFWRANREGRSGVTRIDLFETEDLATRIGGQVRGFDPTRYMPAELASRSERVVQFALAASSMALQDSRIDLAQVDRDRVGVILGSGAGGCSSARSR